VQKSLKKTQIFAQNIENKGPEIFVPPRSMVLKVVTGKILETLELSWQPTAFVLTSIDRVPAFEPLPRATMDELSTRIYYLTDNRYASMLSDVKAEDQEKSVGILIEFQFGNAGAGHSSD
jgi:hypothetical protein